MFPVTRQIVVFAVLSNNTVRRINESCRSDRLPNDLYLRDLCGTWFGENPRRIVVASAAPGMRKLHEIA